MKSLCLFVAVFGALLPCRAFAQVPLIDGLGGPIGYGSACLGPNDDGTSRQVDLSPVFPMGLRFFDQTHTSMFVNTNGNITFSDALPQYTPEAFPVAERPMIAPFWADVDIRHSAADCENDDGGTGYAGDCLSPSDNGVWWHVDTTERRVVVTWDRTGYYDCHTDKVMSFQLVLTPFEAGSCSSIGDFDVEFRFNRCEWNTGDASGGSGGLAGMAGPMTVPCIGPICPLDPTVSCVGGSCTVDTMPVAAQAGFDAGNTMDFVEIPGSRTNEIHTILCTMSNVGEPGVWRFQIRGGTVVCPDAGQACDTGMQGACGGGRTQCVGGGTECGPVVTATDERCDAVDNDCDGTIDEGDGLCRADLEVCDQGRCIEVCFEGGCDPGQTCTDSGNCVDIGCESMTCPLGQRCRGGACVDACALVHCPPGLSCESGQCVDLCDSSTCDPTCTVCSEGSCIARCDLTDCPTGKECASDGHCVDLGCAALTCATGEVCAAGACVDACTDAVCPDGDRCLQGACYREGEMPPPPRTDGSTDPDGGTIPGGRTGDRGGCGCGTTPVVADWFWAVLLLLWATRLRKRRR